MLLLPLVSSMLCISCFLIHQQFPSWFRLVYSIYTIGLACTAPLAKTFPSTPCPWGVAPRTGSPYFNPYLAADLFLLPPANGK